ncbi:CD99 molecule isoform X2 [Coregonus clupeaformis]|uniref:CD99 molecule isoform X2 n=1 Tax=Coregonus clupeaformis TaxID=59861 RepID=UPI001BE0EE5F|nr:CD99 molecule isoform X2 [Coregonus clupeaformis]
MKSCLWIALLVTLAIGTKTQDFDLSDALGLDDPIPTTIPKQPKQPAKDPSPGGGFDLLDALGPEEPEKPAGIPPKEGGTDPKPAPPPAPVDPKKPAGDGMGFDLSDALGPDPVPDKPAVVPPKDGGTGGGSLGDNDLFDVSNDGGYKPDPGKGGGGGARAADPASDPNGGGGAPADQPQEAGSGQIAGIVSGIGVALLGAASSYFAYQKKKLCFKIQGGVDPESGKNAHGAQSDPQD